MASEFFQGSDPNEAAKKEEERIMRTMAHKSGKGFQFGNRVITNPPPAAAPPSHSHAAPAAPAHTATAAAVHHAPRSFAAPQASSSLFERAASNAGSAPQAAAPAPVQVSAAPAAPAGTSGLFARAAANAEPVHHQPAPTPSAANPAGWPGQTTGGSGVDTHSTSNAWSSDNSAEEMARKEEERLRKQFGGMAVQPKAAHAHAAPAAPAPSATKLPEPYAPAVVHTPASHSAPTQSASVPLADQPSVGGAFEHELLAELNQARTNPAAYARLLRDYERSVNGNMLQLPGTNMGVQLKEGLPAVREAAAALEQAKPVSPVTMSLAFSQSSLELVKEHGARGSTNDEIAESTGAAVRLTRHGTWKKRVIETTAYLPVPAKHVVALWLVDDGTPGRLNRNTLLDPHYAVVGVASGPHSRYGRMVVVDWTDGFTEGATAPPPKTQPTQVAEHERITSAPRQGILSELPDGTGFQIDVGVLGVPKSGISVSLHHGTEVVVVRTDASNNVTYKYQLPFAFTADRITAEYLADGRLLIRLLKPVAAAPGTNEITLATYIQGAGPATASRLQIDIKETKDKLLMRTLLSKYAEEITVKLRDGKVVVWECKHVEDDPQEGKQTIISTQTLKLPFEVTAASCNVVQHGAEGATTEVLKPTGAGTPAEVTIPVRG